MADARGSRRPLLRRVGWIVAVVAALIVGAALVWRMEIERALLDPGVPYQIYKPPAAPDYARAAAWALLPSRPDAPPQGEGADVFFVHSTTYKGGREWNAPIGLAGADAELFETVIPNYAGPFQTLGRVFAPRYRQASLYAFTTLRDDAREARRFPLRDVRAALDHYLTRWSRGRPLVLVGVGQGGDLLARVLTEEIVRTPTLRERIAAVYLIHVVAPADAYGPGPALPACERRDQAGCVVAWRQAPEGGEAAGRTLLRRALVWGPEGQLQDLGAGAALCVNPLTGSKSGAAGERANLGAANASGLEWGARPAFLPRQVSAECRDGLLRVSRPQSPSLKTPSGWMEQLRPPPSNLFYADLEADARARVAALNAGKAAPPITERIDVRRAPVHRID